MKYPKAGDLQRQLGVELTDNPCEPCAHTNPWEVRSASGLEGVFADKDDAHAEAENLRQAGVRDVSVYPRQRVRPVPGPKPWTAYDQYAADQAAGYPYPKRNASSRLFAGIYPTGIVYADKARERDGDYLRVARLPFSSLRLQWEPGPHPPELREEIERDAAEIIAQRGQPFEVSGSGQTVILGGAQARPPGAPPQYHAPQGRPPGVPNRSNPHQLSERLRSHQLGHDRVLGTWAPGSRVLLGYWYFFSPASEGYVEPDEWVRIVGNYADTTGVVVIKSETTGAIYERDGRTPLVEVDPASTRLHGNPAGLTAKGERMYEHIRAGYGDDPRAAEIASRTVAARAQDVPGLYKNNPPNVLPVPGQRISSWDYGDGQLVKICEEGNDGSYTATIRLNAGRTVTVPLTRTEYDLVPRKNLERRTGFSRHEQFIGPPQPDRMPKGTPMEYDETIQDFVPLPRHPPGKRR